MADVDEWVDVAQAKPAQDDGWVSVGSPSAPAPVSPGGDFMSVPSLSGPDGMAVAKQAYPSLGPILKAFGHGAKEGWGDEPLGLSPEAVQWLSKKKIFGPEKGGYDNPFQAFNEMLAQTVVGAAQIVGRTGSAALGAYQAAMAETGEQLGDPQFGRDMAAMPEAFFGSPHPMGVPKKMPAGAVFREVPEESRAVLNPQPDAPKFIEAYHGSPHDFDRFDISKIGTGEGAQSYGHGLYFAQNEGVAKSYRESLSDAFVGGKKYDPYNALHVAAAQVEESGSRTAAIKEIEAAIEHDPSDPSEHFSRVLSILKSDRELPKIEATGNLYHVRINVDPEHMLDWDKPLNKQNEFVQAALKQAMGDDWEQFKNADASSAIRKGFIAFNDDTVSKKLSEAGIPGIKYLDQGSRPSDRFIVREENGKYFVESNALRNAAGQSFETRDDASAWADAKEREGKTSNFVVFHHDNVEITHKNGVPVQPSDIYEPGSFPAMISDARDLGVIGPPKPDLTDLAPADRAAAEVPPPKIMAAARAGGDSISGEMGRPEKAGNIRLDQIGINADAKDVILDAAKNNDDFDQARAGNVPLAQVESLSGASGVPSDILTGNDGLGRLMHNDAVIRTWLQAFHQATDEIAGQMQTVARTGDEADIAKLREMKLRFQHMQEQVSGLTAEAGRTLRVFRDFYENKGKAEALGKILEDNPGNDVDSLKRLADTGKGLDDPAQLARYLHDSNQPTFWDKYLYYWVNALISGPVTHIKYIGANAAFGAYEAGVVTPVAGALGAARRLAGGTDGVYAGEAAARTWGLLAGTPDALKAAWTAAKNNVMTPFPNEVAGAAVNPLTQVRPSPIGGKLGFAIGIPGRSAAGIHSFFRWLGYRAEIEAQAYRQASKEGLSTTSQAFWDRRAALADQPTDAMMNAGIENGNHLTFIGEQGSFGKLMNKVANWEAVPRTIDANGKARGGFQPFKLILPFTHIPGQILRAGLEQTPAAFLDSKMRADILGKNGAVAADTARARLIAGGAVSAMVANWAVNDTITGYGPTDQTERAQWLRTHEPYSVRLGGWWYSYNKFGPIGDLVGLVANLVEVGPKVKEGEYAEAAGRVMKATSHIMTDEVGMQGLVNLIEAMDDPDRKMSRFVAGQAASNLPYSSLIRQTASISDPYMREAKTFVDQLRYNVPFARQDLLPKRDWLGQPMTNPGYENIIRQRAVNSDPVDLAVSELRGFRPAPPQARIGGVALPPKMYDEYQATAGGMTRAALEQVVTQPGWSEIPIGIREHIVHNLVENARQTAGSMMQSRHHELILQGISDRQDKINGVKPKKLKD